MEKLIELLNERLQTSDLYDFYDKIYYKEYCGGDVVKIMARIRDKLKPTGDRDADITHLICLKKYEFIKRLVDNKKIDRSAIHIYAEPYYDLRDYTTDDLKKINGVNELLMLLAIQNNPIEFLISILK